MIVTFSINFQRFDRCFRILLLLTLVSLVKTKLYSVNDCKKKKETTEKQRNFQFTPTTFVAAKRCSFCRAQVEVLKIARAIRERLQRGS